MTNLQTKEDKKLIKEAFDDLLQSWQRPKNDNELKLIKKAFDVANEAHMGVRRRSGIPYIMHPIAVAKIVAAEIGLGYKSICAALLHDVVEDADVTIENIRSLFGDKIAYLVDGLTKIEGVIGNETTNQVENFKKMLLTLSDDVRVIIIKIADRLHNMRTLDAMPPNKQMKIANETIYLFAPLAYRLGLYAIKSELEDLSLRFLEPEAFGEITEKVAKAEGNNREFFEHFSAPIIEKLKSNGFNFTLISRTKSTYSIWKKMQLKSIPFEEVYDLFAARIIFEPVADIPERTQCWQIYSLITDIYRPKLDRIRDWVNTPKANGYEALHFTVMCDGEWVEVQVRSRRMDEIAERGFVAHWKYKDEKAQESELDNWLIQIREMLKNPEANAIEFLDHFRMNLFTSEIVVFTPKGDAKTLPKGSTVLDFAYAIHTQVGNKTIGAKVNHKLVPLSQRLYSGDQIEILTAESQKPEREWLDFVTTARAKSIVKASLKAEVDNHFQKGKDIIESRLKELGIEPKARVFRKLIPAYGVNTKDELYSKVGAGLISLDNFEKVLKKNTPNKWVGYWGLEFIIKKITGSGSKKEYDEDDDNGEGAVEGENSKVIDRKKPFLLQEDSLTKTLLYRIAQCCNPIPGDEVIGFVDKHNNVIVHKKKCSVARRLAAQHGDSIVVAKWTTHKVLSFLARLEMRGIDRQGLLNDITKTITEKLNVNIRKLGIESHDGIFEGFAELYVHNTTDLNLLIEQLSKIKSIDTIKRIEDISQKAEE
ncbi:MAG: RelA/SpoT family protein [Prevotellaceae bacterium]|jgi:GTP pyrophosphokinase|nr:RelA/SpoT family protein [Prevotellaceae bacterium]